MKRIIWTSLFIVVLVTAGALFALRELTYAQMPDLREAAQLSLDHTALNRIQKVKPYTGGPLCYVFFGEDKLGRILFVMATKDQILGTEYLEKGIPESRAAEIAKQAGNYKEISELTPGLVTESSKPLSQNPSQRFVWEVYGTNTKGEKQYTYLDFYNGNVLGIYPITPVP